MNRIDVPYVSQYDAQIDPVWQSRACGVVCVQMILAYTKSDTDVTIETLLDEAVCINGYVRGIGWKHDALVSLLHNHGVRAYRETFQSMDYDAATRTMKIGKHQSSFVTAGIEKIQRALKQQKPVIVSVAEWFDGNTSTHLIVLTGYEDEGNSVGFFYNDPNSVVGVKKDLFVSQEKFLQYWRKNAIFIV